MTAPTSRHNIRVFISPGYVDLRAECYSSVDAECQVHVWGNSDTECRYILWWDATGIALDEFYAGTKTVPLLDGTEISIDWNGEVWVWDLRKEHKDNYDTN